MKLRDLSRQRKLIHTDDIHENPKSNADAIIHTHDPNTRTVILAGNPNVGKSTVFNELTGLRQHTGNWPGKTVSIAQGYFSTSQKDYMIVDIPGTYSLMAHSVEEEAARNAICFGHPDTVVVVCDATCLERNLNLVLQTIEICPKVIVCVNLMDEARKKRITLNLPVLSSCLGVPVIGTTARKKKSLEQLTRLLDQVSAPAYKAAPITIPYPKPVEHAISSIEALIAPKLSGRLNSRWVSLTLLDADASLLQEINAYSGTDLLHDKCVENAISLAIEQLLSAGIDSDHFKDMIVSTLVQTAEQIGKQVVKHDNLQYASFDRRLDKILTSRLTGYPVMLLLLALVFWLTITGANIPSRILADGLFWIQDRLTDLFLYLHAPDWLHGILVLGAYRVLAWVVSVMLPPMAIFFPLFTLLEDAGYLPRVAYNLDKTFKRCCACGKQSLCMCMGFGCNAAGIIGCRIIDSPRERLLAILTNNFVPCNGRFPTLIAILTMFFVGSTSPFSKPSKGILSSDTQNSLSPLGSSLLSALLLTALIVFGILMTFAITKLLSKTLLKGVPSFFTLELPPYRRPQIGKVILRSIFDRTLFVLGRAMIVAAPAGLLIWLMANVMIGDSSILSHCAAFLDPFARLMGLDGVILIAFILGFPANEIVVPIIIMAYMAQGSILELDLSQMKALFTANGWTWLTAACTMLFSLMHWPCSTTLLTIRKETGSWYWTALSAVIPTIVGISVCILFTAFVHLFGAI